jgi:peptide/nickel transport system substrate-binding protein
MQVLNRRKRMKRRNWIFLALLVLVPAILFAQGSQKTAKKDILIVAMPADASTLDANGKNDNASINVRRQIFETLLTYNEDMELVPLLAESYKWEGDKVIIFSIRKNVVFHNGDTLKASDVKFSMERAARMKYASNQLGVVDLDACTVVDEYTYKMVLKMPFAPMLANVTVPALSIVSEKAVKSLNDDMTEKPVGTGPYKLSSWNRGDRLELVKFDKYWGKAAGVQKIIYRIISESTSRAIEVETGGVDLSYDITPIDYKNLKTNKSVVIARDMGLRTDYVGFNCSKAPFNDARIRQALTYALDTKAIVDAVYMGTNQPGRGMIAPTVWGYSNDIQLLKYNPAKAKELLAQAGFPNGLKTTIWTNDTQVRIDIAEIMQSELKKVGVEANVQVVEWGTYLKMIEDKSLDIFILGISAPTGDGDALYNQFQSQSHFSGNTAHFKNATVDALLQATREKTDRKQRFAAIQKVHQEIVNLAPWVPIAHVEYITAMRANVVGFRNHPSGVHYLGDVNFK